MKARVDKEKCIGCGVCVNISPDVFEIGDDDFSKVKVDVVPKDKENEVNEACQSCPVEAIEIFED